jgi:subtilisin family serine protease
LLGLKVLDADGTGSNADIAAGINYATMLRQNGEANVRVLNASFASSLPSDAISNSIRAAGEAGIMLVTAAGNFGEDIDAPTHQSFPAEYPHDNIIVVANVQSDGALTSSSNYGDTEVDLAAPGMSILSTARGDGYAELSGTSMSAPVVSGALALFIPHISLASCSRRLLAWQDRVSLLRRFGL